jgi:hypothetical protein
MKIREALLLIDGCFLSLTAIEQNGKAANARRSESTATSRSVSMMSAT